MKKKHNQSQNQQISLQIQEENSFPKFSLDLPERLEVPFSFLNLDSVSQLSSQNNDIRQSQSKNYKFFTGNNHAQYLDFSPAEYSDNENRQALSKEEIKKRNRESATKCRKKRKQYIERLQEECVLNRKKINFLTIKVKELQNQLNQIKYSNTTQKQTFTQINRVCVKKLSQILNENQKNQIQKYIMEMKGRIGLAGKVRVNLLNFYMSQFMENMLTDFEKYLISSALKGSGFWGKQQNKFDRQIRQILNLSQQKKSLLIKNSYPKVYKQATLYHEICQKIYQNYSALTIQANNLQETMIKLKQDLQITNMGKAVVFFQQNKHRVQIQKLKQQWIQSFRINDEALQVNSKLRKKCKFSLEENIEL